MNAETAHKLCRLNNEFYSAHAASFSSTRHAPWAGWTRCAEVLENVWRAEGGLDGADARYARRDSGGVADAARSTAGRQRRVLDLACGNLRFEAFLSRSMPAFDVSFFAVDDCDDLADRSALAGEGTGLGQAPVSVAYQSLDVLAACEAGDDLAAALEAPTCDAAMSFGFMHHVPLPAWRRAIIEALMDKVGSGGIVAVSFWRFLNDEGLASKARATHAEGMRERGLPPLDEGDYLLGWKNEPSAYRYCHSFSTAQIDELVEGLTHRAHPVARFSADGRTRDLNEYVIWKTL